MLEARGVDCTRQRRTLFAGLSLALSPGESLRVATSVGTTSSAFPGSAFVKPVNLLNWHK